MLICMGLGRLRCLRYDQRRCAGAAYVAGDRVLKDPLWVSVLLVTYYFELHCVGVLSTLVWCADVRES